MASSAHDADLKGNNLRRAIHPQTFIAVAFLFSGAPPPPPPPPVQRIEKKPGLDRVKTERWLTYSANTKLFICEPEVFSHPS